MKFRKLTVFVSLTDHRSNIECLSLGVRELRACRRHLQVQVWQAQFARRFAGVGRSDRRGEGTSSFMGATR